LARKKLGKYEIIDRIGRGGMAEVYRGYHAALDRYVAIKLLHPFLADDPEFKDRFENEARNVAKLRHPNIVQVYDFEYDAEGESYYMVMELINGPTIKDRLFDLSAAGETFPLGEAISVVRTAAEALAYAHQRGMIHRDVKPANLMIDEDGRLVLTDFGIAKIVTGAHFTASGGMVGTPAYMAPEQGLGDSGDERSDIYSLGVILYQLVTGRLPYDADTPLAIILKHVNDPLPAPAQFVPRLAPDLDAVICHVLEKNPNSRYQSALDFARDLALLNEDGSRRQPGDTGAFEVVQLMANPTPTSAMARPGALIAPPPNAPRAPLLDTTPPGAAAGAPGRLRPLTAASLIGAILLLMLVALGGFGGGSRTFGGGSGTGSASPSTATQAAVALLPPDATRTPEATELGTRLALSATPSARAPTRTPAPRTAAPTPTQTPAPSATPSPSITPSPTANLTATEAVSFVMTAAAATATPDATQTLAACDLQYIVVQPENYNAPPPVRDVSNPRLVRANREFSFDLVVENVGSCAWPTGTRLTFNAALTANPDERVNLKPLRDVCEPDSIRPGLNFARQEQPNFYIKSPVDLIELAEPITFTGLAPNMFGCYYGVWDLLYPNSSAPIGRPLVLAIRVWGGG